MAEYKHFYQKQLREEFHDSLVPSIGDTKTEIVQSSSKTTGNSDITMFQQRDQRFANEDFDSSDTQNDDVGRLNPVLNKKVNNFVLQEASNNKRLQRSPPLLFNAKDNMRLLETHSVSSFGSQQLKTTVKSVTDHASSNQRKSSLPVEEQSTPITTNDRYSHNFYVGTLVEVQLEDKTNYHSGKIIRSHFDGSYDILFDNGERKFGITKNQIRLQQNGEYNVNQTGKKQSDNTTDIQPDQVSEILAEDKLKVGSMVELRKKSDGKFVSGKIMRSRLDGTFDVLCSDGDKEYGEFGVSIESIRLKTSVSQPIMIQSSPKIQKPDSASKSTEIELSVGTAVEARYRGKGKYYPGKITRKRFDGTYDVLYSDGAREIGVPAELIRVRGNERIEKINPIHRNNDTTNSIYVQPKTEESGPNEVVSMISTKLEPNWGAAMEANQKGKDNNDHAGKVIRQRIDGSNEMLRDDGRELELGVRRELVRSKDGQTSEIDPFKTADLSEDKDRNDIEVGTEIEATFKGKDKFSPEKITRKRFDGSYDIGYNDGSKNIGKILLGTIKNIREDNSFDIQYDDGCIERSERKDLIQEDTDISADSNCGKVKTNCPDIHSDGVGDISKDPSRRNWAIAQTQNKNERASSASSDRGLYVGDKVECRFRGAMNSRYYPGHIARIHSDGTYDVDYDDGDKDQHLGAEHIRPLVSDRSHEDVEAGLDKNKGSVMDMMDGGGSSCRFKTAEKNTTKDMVQNSQADGIENISNDLSRHKRAIAHTQNNNERASRDRRGLCVGDKVECRFRGAMNSRYYPGHIARIHPDGTYDVDYDDGDKDRYLGPEHIRPLVSSTRYENTVEGLDRMKNAKNTTKDMVQGNQVDGAGDISKFPSRRNWAIAQTQNKNERASSASSDRGLYVGDKVECRFRGAMNSRYYPGHIARIHSDGTYDVDYDDGDKDQHLGAEHIRPLVSDRSHEDVEAGLDKNKGSVMDMMDGGGSSCRFKNAEKNTTKDMVQDSQADGIENISNDLSRHKRAIAQTQNNNERASRDRQGLRVGDKVECRFRGAMNSRYYPGHIARIHPDGTYDVDYDDGDKDRYLGPEHIRLLVSSSKHDKRMQLNNSSPQDGHFNVGDRVEAKFQRSSFVPGVISRVSSPFMYDVSYDNGHKEFGVPVDYIRKLPSNIDDSGKSRGGQVDGRGNEKEGQKMHEELLNKLESALKGIENELSAVKCILSEMRGGALSRRDGNNND